MTRKRATLAIVISCLCATTFGCADESDDDGSDAASDPQTADGDADDSDDSDDSDGPIDNTAACKDFAQSVSCGELDFSTVLPCDSYAGLTCELVDYFMCLEDGFSCTDGVFDASAWQGCASLVACE